MKQELIIIEKKIKIGISACCIGCPVRYNNKGTNLLLSLGREKYDFTWCPVCPESMAGLGVPREPIHIAGENGSKVWMDEAIVKNRKGINVTEMLKEGATACLSTLKRADAIAYVYMDGSPSCGVYRTSLKKQRRGNPPGVFGSLLLDNGYFLIPSTDLQSPLKWWDWRRRLLAFVWLKNCEVNKIKEIYEIWHTAKNLLQELDEKWARSIGAELAGLNKSDLDVFWQKLKYESLQVLRKPSTKQRIVNHLWKNYTYYRKATGKSIPEIKDPTFLRNITTIAKELTKMERESKENEILFGSSPVVYRPER